ncbi:Hypothetical_protein [Hexamita inflata]|uniref:Hypothetical_protein n=1 Tax=Hexamita inflata TaxID=28002 RepID=A0AA86NV95_9EUKA|nr:Hypothetical protein HINF_LOCUS14877 [Hexamita inflata]
MNIQIYFNHQLIRQKQHLICLNYIINQNLLKTITDINDDQEEFEQISSVHYEDLIPNGQFKSELFKQLISSARPSHSESFSADPVQFTQCQTRFRESLETIEDYENQNTDEEVQITELLQLK